VLLVATVAIASEQGLWGMKDPASSLYTARLIAIEKDSDLVFNYFTEGRWRCEVPGIAKRIPNSNKYLFKNTKEYWLHQGYEGYQSSEPISSCSVEFSFEGDAVKIKESGNCRSFCGAGGSLDAILNRVSN
jgi:hypothetical protein